MAARFESDVVPLGHLHAIRAIHSYGASSRLWVSGWPLPRRDDSAVSSEDRHTLNDCLEWFEKNVKVSDRFNRSTSKGYYRRATRGIAWFRDSAAECIARMHRIKDVLERNGHQVDVLFETRLGYVVYEDDFQVVAEPFSETRTGR